LIAINVALSRSMVGACAVVFAAFIVVLIMGRVRFGRVVLLVLSIAALAGLFLGSGMLREGNATLINRFQTADDSEGSFFLRAFSVFVIPGTFLHRPA